MIYQTIEDQPKELLISRIKALEELCLSQSTKRTELEELIRKQRITIANYGFMIKT